MSKPSMERPLGPRPAQPNDRNKAFESIFGRPSAVHHRMPPQQQQYPPSYLPAGRAPSPSVIPQLDSRQPYPYAQNYTQSYAPYRAQPTLGPMGNSSPQYDASAYTLDPTMYTQYSQASYGTGTYASTPPQQGSSARRSMQSLRSPVTVAPSPSNSPDLVHGASGITPAQAYQAQVYPSLHGPPRPHNLPPGAAPPAWYTNGHAQPASLSPLASSMANPNPSTSNQTLNSTPQPNYSLPAVETLTPIMSTDYLVPSVESQSDFFIMTCSNYSLNGHSYDPLQRFCRQGRNRLRILS